MADRVKKKNGKGVGPWLWIGILLVISILFNIAAFSQVGE